MYKENTPYQGQTRKPEVEKFVRDFRSGIQPQLLCPSKAKYRGRMIGTLDNRELNYLINGYRGCGWLDVAEVLEAEWSRRQGS